jgi:hypothetical protein
MNKAAKTHWIIMGGSHGCLPDFCQALESRRDAVDVAINVYELSRRQATELRQTQSVELRQNQGAEYCEISECGCNKPWIHGDLSTPADWPQYSLNEPKSESAGA